MRLEILSRDFPLSPALSAHTHNRVGTAVDRFINRIGSIIVRLMDANGDRGGVDKICRIEVSVPGGPALVIGAIDRDPYVAVDRATTTLKETVARQFERLTARRRQSSTHRRT